jgi:hypothetical protein
MNIVELGNRLRRAITVVKARGSNHSFVTREIEIGQGGIRLLPLDESQALTEVAFPSYYSLLSRAPTRFSPAMGPRATGEVVTEVGA